MAIAKLRLLLDPLSRLERFLCRLLLLPLRSLPPQLGELRVCGARGGEQPRDERDEHAVQAVDDKAEADEEQEGPSPRGRLQVGHSRGSQRGMLAVALPVDVT